MKAYRVHLSSWTASFRYPNLISGFQATLPVPPLSTIWGIISAAAGQWVAPSGEKLGYVFSSKEKQVGVIETVYQFEKNNLAKSNVIRREMLFDNDLWIYTTQPKIAETFQAPYFPLLLGRSGDLATVRHTTEVELEEKKSLKQLKGTIVPFEKDRLMPAPMQALPIYFSDQIPRRSLKVKPFFLLESTYQQIDPLECQGAYDAELKQEIFWHED